MTKKKCCSSSFSTSWLVLIASRSNALIFPLFTLRFSFSEIAFFVFVLSPLCVSLSLPPFDEINFLVLLLVFELLVCEVKGKRRRRRNLFLLIIFYISEHATRKICAAFREMGDSWLNKCFSGKRPIFSSLKKAIFLIIISTPPFFPSSFAAKSSWLN